MPAYGPRPGARARPEACRGPGTSRPRMLPCYGAGPQYSARLARYGSVHCCGLVGFSSTWSSHRHGRCGGRRLRRLRRGARRWLQQPRSCSSRLFSPRCSPRSAAPSLPYSRCVPYSPILLSRRFDLSRCSVILAIFCFSSCFLRFSLIVCHFPESDPVRSWVYCRRIGTVGESGMCRAKWCGEFMNLLSLVVKKLH